ncbi:hypothetical protein AgCh_035207 [Apium graveolens]
MAPKDLIIDCAKFVPNNYAAILNHAEAPSDLHFVQDLLAHSEIRYVLTQPQVISSQQVLTFWRTGHFDNGGATGTPSIIFEVNDVEHVVTPGAVRKALHLPEGCIFSTVEEPVLQQLMANLGYEKSLAKLGQLKRAHIRKEWSFFFDCITKAFANKCSNFDAIPIMSQHIGYAIIHQTHFDFASDVLGFIGDRMTEDRNVTPQKRRRIVLRDESDSEEQVSVSEPVVKEAEKVSSQKDTGIGGSKLLKRLRRMHSAETPKESPPSKRYKKQRAQRYMAESVSEDEEAAAKEGDQESLISQEPEFAEAIASTPPLSPTQETTQDKVSTPPVSPVNEPVSTADPGKSAEIDIHNLIVPEVLYLEVPPAQINPSMTPIPDVNETPELSTTPSLQLDIEDQTKEDDVEASIASHTVFLSQDVDSVSSDSANADDTGDAATNADDDEAGPSGHVPLQAPSKSKLVKKFVRGDAPVPWSETPRGQEWTKEWNTVTFVSFEKILVEHLAKADEMLINDDFKTQLRVTALSTRHLQGQHSTTHAEVHKIQEALLKQGTTMKLEKKSFFKPTFDRVAYIEKTQEKQQSQIDEILKNQASQQSQLDEIQSSVELLVSLLLPADAKKGEKVIKSKYKIVKTLKGKDDEKDDQGNSGMSGGHGQGRGLSSRRPGTTSHRTSSDTGRRITSDTGKRISSDKLLDLDEEISRQLFLKENPGMDFESIMEEEGRLKSEKVKSKSEASVGKKKLPTAKGIVIKERTNPVAIKARSQLQIHPRSKGKEKVGEPVKVYVPPVDEEISVEDADLTLTSRKISKTTSDMAQVVQSQDIVSSNIILKQATSDIAQVDLISEDKSKETSDIAHVKSSRLLLPGFTKAKQTQPLKTAASGFEARVVTGKEARDKSGLGSADERRVQNTTNDPTSLSEPDGRVYHIRENVIPLKYFEELEHVLFLLQVNDRITESAANYLKTQIQRQKRLYSVKSDSTYFPKYRDHKGDIVEMKPNSDKIITTFLGYKAVEFNLESDKAYLIRLDQDIRKAKINDLRAAIFQTGEDSAELKDAKRRMIDELRYSERYPPLGLRSIAAIEELPDHYAEQVHKSGREMDCLIQKHEVEMSDVKKNHFEALEEYNPIVSSKIISGRFSGDRNGHRLLDTQIPADPFLRSATPVLQRGRRLIQFDSVGKEMVDASVVDIGISKKGKITGNIVKVDEHRHRVDELQLQVDKIEKRVKEVQKFCTTSKNQLNTVKDHPTRKDRDKEKHIPGMKRQQQDASRRDAAAAKRMQELMRQFGTIFRQEILKPVNF